MRSAPLKITSGSRLVLESSAPIWRREGASFARASDVHAAKHHERIPTRFGKLRSDLETRTSELRAAERFPLRFGKIAGRTTAVFRRSGTRAPLFKPRACLGLDSLGRTSDVFRLRRWHRPSPTFGGEMRVAPAAREMRAAPARVRPISSG